MPRHAIIVFLLVMLPVECATGSDAPTSRPVLDDRIAAEIEHLGAAKKNEANAAVQALVRIGKPAAAALVNALNDPRNDFRANAADALRQLLAADPSAAPNKHDEMFWQHRLAQVRTGMLLRDALAILLPELSPAEREVDQSEEWSGGSGTCEWGLDDYWTLTIYLKDYNQRKLLAPPDLNIQVRMTWVKPPSDFTGTWTAWYVNGQKCNEIQYRKGQYDGTFTAYYDNGSKCYIQQYKMGICDGLDTGWYRSGMKLYEGRYEKGKQIGTWQRWSETGVLQSTKD